MPQDPAEHLLRLASEQGSAWCPGTGDEPGVALCTAVRRTAMRQDEEEAEPQVKTRSHDSTPDLRPAPTHEKLLLHLLCRRTTTRPFRSTASRGTARHYATASAGSARLTKPSSRSTRRSRPRHLDSSLLFPRQCCATSTLARMALEASIGDSGLVDAANASNRISRAEILGQFCAHAPAATQLMNSIYGNRPYIVASDALIRSHQAPSRMIRSGRSSLRSSCSRHSTA